MTVLRVVWGAVKDVWEELFILALMNLVTVLLLVPVVTFPPALAGLWAAANLAARGKSIAWSDYFGAFKRFFGKSWALAGINIGIIVEVNVKVRLGGRQQPQEARELAAGGHGCVLQHRRKQPQHLVPRHRRHAVSRLVPCPHKLRQRQGR